MRRIGVLVGFRANDPQGEARVAALRQGLQALGWIDGRNLRTDLSWGAGDADSVRKRAAEVMALAPEVILAAGSSAVAALQQQTRAVPIVFVQVVDPVGGGFVESLAARAATSPALSQFEYGMSGKWLELLKEIAPSVTRVAILRDPGITAGAGQLGAIQSVAPSFGVELHPLDVRDAPDIERAIAAFARSSNGGLIVTGANLANTHRELIITLAARNKLPAVYINRFYVTDGGLISYGADPVDPYRRAASYVDRILKGEKPADLPVQPQPNSNWSSISRPPRRSASKCRRRFSPAPTR